MENQPEASVETLGEPRLACALGLPPPGEAGQSGLKQATPNE